MIFYPKHHTEDIIGDLMSEIKRSIFLSRKPFIRHDALGNPYLYETDMSDNPQKFNEEFLYICSNSYPSYSVDYQMTAMGIMGHGTEDAIVIDSMGGAVGRISIGGVRVGDAVYRSNGFFAREVRKMRSIIQLLDNAYILRIYNATLLDSEGVIREVGNSYFDFFVFLKDIRYVTVAGRPKDMNVTMNLIQRNMLKGFNKYEGGTVPYG